MGDAQSSLTGTTAQRLQRLAQLYQQGQASALVERTLDKLLAHEAQVCHAQMRDNLRQRLHVLTGEAQALPQV